MKKILGFSEVLRVLKEIEPQRTQRAQGKESTGFFRFLAYGLIL
jgi:hypothetical protein